MGTFTVNPSTRLTRALLHRGMTLKMLAEKSALKYHRLRKINGGSAASEGEKAVIAHALSMSPLALWSVDLEVDGLSAPVVRKYVNDLMASDDFAFLIGRVIGQLKESATI